MRSAELVNRLRLVGVALPVAASPDPDEAGVLVDARGIDFATVDVNGERTDADTAEIVRLLAIVLNAHARRAEDDPAAEFAAALDRQAARRAADRRAAI